MAAAFEIFRFSIVENSCCDVIVKMKMFPFAKLFIKIIDNLQTKRVRDLKILPNLEHRLRVKISIFTKGNILRCSLLQNDGRVMLRAAHSNLNKKNKKEQANSHALGRIADLVLINIVL